MRKNIFILSTFVLILSCSPKIKSIQAFERKGKEFVLWKTTMFDKNGLELKSISPWENGNEMITSIEYNSNRKVLEKTCYYVKSEDTCYLQYFLKFEFDRKSNTEKQTFYESDSAVRYIRETQKTKMLKITKSKSWQRNPTKTPNLKDAIVSIDTAHLDHKNRVIKRSYYHPKTNSLWFSEIYNYSKDSFSVTTIGAVRDTTLKFQITELDKLVRRNNIDYEFINQKEFEYKINYY